MPNLFRFLLERYHSLNIRPPITAALIGGTFVLLAALVNLRTIAVKTNPQADAVLSKPVETTPTQQAKPTDPYEFAQAVIRSLASAADARQTLVSTKTTGDFVTDTLKTMTDARIGINKLGNAKVELAGFQGSENRTIATAVEGFETAYDVVMDAVQKGLVVQEKIVTVEDDKELMSLMSELSKHLVQADEGWKLLMYATAAATYALVDNERSIDGKLRYLTITAQQRAELLSDLESYFGDPVKRGMQEGRYATDVAPASLWEFLNQPWIPATAPSS